MEISSHFVANSQYSHKKDDAVLGGDTSRLAASANISQIAVIFLIP